MHLQCTCRLTAAVCRHRMPVSRAGAVGGRGSPSCALCLRLQRGCSVRVWGLTSWGLGTTQRGSEGGGRLMLTTLPRWMSVDKWITLIIPLKGTHEDYCAEGRRSGGNRADWGG